MNDQILLIGGANSPGKLWLASDPNHWTLLTASASPVLATGMRACS